MFKKIITICFFSIMAAWCFLSYAHETKAITSASDTVSRSWPNASSSHVITFLTTASIPPSGKIVLTPQAGSFFIPAGFDFGDIDLAKSMVRSGPYADRDLAAVPGVAVDGVAVVTGTTNGSITITLNSSYGIDIGNYVQIELGTMATYGGIGNSELYNPAAIDSYYIDIETLNSGNALIKRSRVMMAVAEPVTMSAGFGKSRSKNAPSGYLSFGTTQTVLSLATNYLATCRYSQTASTSYDDMTGNFTYTTGPSVFHSVMASGLSQTETSNFYVRCMDMGGVKDEITDCIYTIGGSATSTIATTCVDYLISFNISNVEGGEDDETGVPGPGGGGSGGGGGGGLGNDRGRGRGKLLPYPPLPTNPGVAFAGWAYPNVDVVLLRDGIEEGAIKSDAGAKFGVFLPDLAQGVYTFGLWANDKNGTRSITYSTTFWIDEGTQTVVSDIFLPPTISASSNTLNIGQLLEVFGQSVPGSTVDVWLYPGLSNEISETKAIKGQSVADAFGVWALSLSTTALTVSGNYSVSARSTITGGPVSDWGRAASIIIGGEAPKENICAGADLNQDGRVNITDFSILLYYWNTDNACADQNKSGKVDLIDFSIMLYYWTG